MPGFVFRLIPPRPSFAFDMSDDERDVMTAHVAYWGTLAREGKGEAETIRATTPRCARHSGSVRDRADAPAGDSGSEVRGHSRLSSLSAGR